MSDLTRFRNHCRRMATATHKPDCPSLTARKPYWPMWEVWPDGQGMSWLGPAPSWHPPSCEGCVTDTDRELFDRLAGEVDDYLAPQTDLFGALTNESSCSADRSA